MQSDQLSTDQRWIVMLRKQLKNAEVEMTVQLATATVTLREILKMKAGDFIPLEIPAKVVAMVDEIAVMECHYGTQGRQYALKVDHFIAVEEAETLPGERNG